MPNIAEIEHASGVVEKVVRSTHLQYSAELSELSGGQVWFKPEHTQITGSFKIRGALNRISTLADNERGRGVIAASAGNHGQGVAFAAKLAGVEATIVVPLGASLSKIERIKNLGAEVVRAGSDYNEAERHALEIQGASGQTFIHAFDDERVIAGQGTLGLEIVDELPDVDYVVAGIGGGGLISGIAQAVKSRRSEVKVFGVEPAGAAKVSASLKEGKLVTLDSVDTFADGLATRKAGNLTFDIIREMVDDTVTVDDDEIAEAILFMLETSKQLVEGAGAAPVAAIMKRKLDVEGKKGVVVLSGGNIDVSLIDKIIKRGLQKAGRFLEVTTVLPDKPGSLHQLTGILAELGANIEATHHDRTGKHTSLTQSRLGLTLEVSGVEHAHIVLDMMKANGYEILQNGDNGNGFDKNEAKGI